MKRNCEIVNIVTGFAQYSRWINTIQVCFFFFFCRGVPLILISRTVLKREKDEKPKNKGPARKGVVVRFCCDGFQTLGSSRN